MPPSRMRVRGDIIEFYRRDRAGQNQREQFIRLPSAWVQARSVA